MQAQCESASYYLTSDTASKRMYDILKDNEKVSFDFTDIHIPFARFLIFGLSSNVYL